MPRLLDVKNLTVGIKDKKRTLKAVDNISFSIDEGEIVGLAGESGCGKSTTALSITNLLPLGFQILSGEIKLNNVLLSNMDELELCNVREKEIGIIFQDSKQALNPLMRVGHQIAEMLEKDTGKKQSLKILENLGFEEPLKIFNAFPHQLSGGMCQRIMAAIAAIRFPSLLIADEPSSSLDEESQLNVLSHLMKMNKDYETSILIISHDLSLLRQYCSRILVMYAGKIVEDCKAEKLYSPLHPYTDALINTIPSKEKRGKKLKTISGKVPAIEDNFSGCPFAPRCQKTKKICLEEFPGAKKTEDNHLVYCYYPIEGYNE